MESVTRVPLQDEWYKSNGNRQALQLLVGWIFPCWSTTKTVCWIKVPQISIDDTFLLDLGLTLSNSGNAFIKISAAESHKYDCVLNQTNISQADRNLCIVNELSPYSLPAVFLYIFPTVGRSFSVYTIQEPIFHTLTVLSCWFCWDLLDKIASCVYDR